MADLGQTEIVASEAPPKIKASRNPILDDAITPTLLKLALPNIVAMGAGISVLIAETTYVGILGIAPLAAIALMFPLIILMMTMSGGAMGGGAASAIARALGAGDRLRASTLAIHALTIGVCIGLTFSVLLLTFGEQILTWMGGRGAVLAEALAFSQIFFCGVVLIWVMNTLVAILRGTGNMVLPSAIVFSSAACQIVFGGILSLGLFGVPQLGIRGIAIGQLSGVAIGVLVMGWYRPERPQPHLAARAAVSLPSRDVHGHSAGRRAVMLLSGAVGADCGRADLDARALRTRRCLPPTASARVWNSSSHRSPSPAVSRPCRWSAWRSAQGKSPARGGWPGRAHSYRRSASAR